MPTKPRSSGAVNATTRATRPDCVAGSAVVLRERAQLLLVLERSEQLDVLLGHGVHLRAWVGTPAGRQVVPGALPNGLLPFPVCEERSVDRHAETDRQRSCGA